MDEKRFRLNNDFLIEDYLFERTLSGDDEFIQEIVDCLNELHESNKELKEKNWKIIKLIIEYDTTNKYSEKEVINEIKDVLNLVMIE